MPLALFPLAVTVESLIVRLPAERPWAPLLLKLTTDLPLMSKLEPLEPLPLLLMTSTFELTILMVSVPVKPERLLSERKVEFVIFTL